MCVLFGLHKQPNNSEMLWELLLKIVNEKNELVFITRDLNNLIKGVLFYM